MEDWTDRCTQGDFEQIGAICVSLFSTERPKSPRQEPAAVKMEMRQLLDDFRNRIKQRIFALKIKHRQELLHFREIRKKLSVVTLSYRRKDSSEIEQQV